MTSVRRVDQAGAGDHDEAEAKEEVKPYQPLKVLGGIREKGFDGDAGKRGRVSFPQPSVRPFPVARHRSEGPHWKPQPEPETFPMPDDFEELGAESLAAVAKPLIPKKKPTLNLSRWKTERNSKDNGLKGPAEASLRIEEITEVEEPKSTSGESKIEGASEAVSRPRVTFTLPIKNTADEATESRSKPVEYAGLSRLRGDSGASSRGEEKVTGVERTRAESEEASIDEENRATIASMSSAELAEAQAELLSKLKPEVIEMLRMRRLKEHKKVDADAAIITPELKQEPFADGKEVVKSSPAREPLKNPRVPVHSPDIEEELKQEPASAQNIVPQFEQGSGWPKSWTERVEAVRLHRFDMEGRLMAMDEAPIQETSDTSPSLQQSNLQSISERDFLRSEGDPAGMGYTLKEAADLVRSTVAGHRAFALRLIASVLENAVVRLQEQKTRSFLDQNQRTSNEADWQAVWAYALGPEPGLTLTLRLALDDTHTTVVVSCARALQALLSCSANNAIFDLHESCWPKRRLLYTGPVFRRHTKQDEGFLGGGRWKYNIKASELYPKNATSEEEDGDGKETVGDDATVASKDCAAGLIRMGLLPRIRYILEVEKLKAAEDQLLDVIVALARHSSAASEAVMKCPRLVDTVIQRFILVNEDRDGGLHSSQSCRTKAIELLKVLSQASRLSCSKFFNSGAIQMAQSELYTRQSAKIGDAACSTIVNSLRLWQICIEYKMGMSTFSDIYPTLCFWLSPLTKEELLSHDALTLAQESYRLLERLAQTLPRLHSSDEETLQSFETDEDEEEEHWAWRVAVPLVDTALGWLSDERLSAITEQVSKRGVSSLKLIETLTSVLQFLATVSEKILRSTNDTPFIPTFVPRLGLRLAAEKFVVGSGTLFGALSSIRHVRDEETTLAATYCLQAAIRLLNNVDEVIKAARTQSVPSEASRGSTQPHKILEAGLIISCRRELQELLTDVGDEVLANTGLLQSFEINGRGGPAPGLGLGWGAFGGGSWSRQVLVAQATARLVMLLLDLPTLDPNDMLHRLSLAFGVAALATPEDGELVKQACSKLLLHPRTSSSLAKFVEDTVTDLDSSLKELSLSRESLVKLEPGKMSKMLLEHFTWTWTSRKNHKAVQNDAKGILKGGTRLPPVLENSGAYTSSLAKEWARQRLPLPSHWILSPMATNITRLLYKPEGEEEIGVSTVDEIEKSLMEETVKSGLSWLLGLEALYSKSKDNNHPFHLIPVVRKLHALSSVYVLGGDISLQVETKAAIGVLQEIYGRQLEAQRLDFERLIDMNYTSFGESLAEQFVATSFGELIFARQVALHLQQGVPDPVRLGVWRILADAHVLRLLPPLTECCGQQSRYLYPFERNAEIVAAYVDVWTSAALDTPLAQSSLAFTLCRHHIAGHFLGSSILSNDPQVQVLVAKVVRSSLRKSEYQGKVVNLLNYQPPSPQPQDYKDLEARVAFLSEACGVNAPLLNQVKRLGRLVNPVK